MTDVPTATGFKDASNDAGVIRDWWTKTPDANIAIACGKSGIAVLDVDHGLADDAAALLWMGRNMIPATYVVRTGRRPEMGLQFYFSGTMQDVGLFQLDGCSGQIKSAGGYVMAAGSIHPDSGLAYAVKNDLPLAPLPSVVASLRTKSEKKQATDNVKVPKSAWTLPVQAGENRTGFLMEQTGAMRNLGCGKDAILARMIELNDDPDIIAEPVSMDRLESTAENCAKFPVPEQLPEVTIGGKSASAAVVTTDKAESKEYDEDDAEVSKTGKEQPHYPRHVWAGTVYGEFADIAVKGNYIPWKFFAESLRTITGAIVGRKLRSEMYGANARAYTVLIGGPGSGKGTSMEWAEAVFSEQWEGMTRTNAALLFGPSDWPWRSTDIGAQIGNLRSAPGLMKMLEPRRLKKGEQRDPLEVWKPAPRIITIEEEIRGLFSNFANDTTGAGLESVLCELFDRETFTSTATKDRQPERGHCMYSMLGAITPFYWDQVFSQVSSTDSGFFSRLNIIGTERDKRKSRLAYA
jgi:hypothetical protein